MNDNKKKKPSPEVTGKIPPQAIELEIAVLGAIMLESDVYFEVADIFLPEIFYKDSHALIAQAIVSLKNKSNPVDIQTVVEELKRMGKLESVGGAYEVVVLTNGVVSSAHVPFHLRLLMQYAIKREVIKAGTIMINEGYDDSTDVFDVIDNVGRSVSTLTNKIITGKIDSMATLYNKAIAYNSILISKKGLAGVPSGYQRMDRLTGGWQKSDLIIVAARPAMGKTALVLSYARNAAVMYNIPVAVFSLEMSSLQLTARLQSQETGMKLEKFLREGLNEIEEQDTMNTCEKLINSPLFIDDTPGISVFELRNKARKLKREKNIQLICIDYLQLMNGGGKFVNKESEISFISQSLKSLAKELDIPIIALSQLSRAVETRGGDKIPMLSDLRDSGSLEQDADMVIFIHRPEYYGIMEDGNGVSTAGKAQAIIAKHRNGSTENVKMGWEGMCTRFFDVGESFSSFINQPKIKAAPDPNKFIEPEQSEIVHT